MKIVVTQDDIDSGVRSHCYLCPVALAFARTLGLTSTESISLDVRVGIVQCCIDRYRHLAWMLPLVARLWILGFDHSKDKSTICPIEFETKEISL